ncbi:hypothetical protein [Kistimonas asteriae]|uniref:hypothetical protein n=1 Tax=Kistimonas asteriae TaxID=517724 RepID=UPI001BAB0813|nr:hypothetical protein [Kistimonas asteriae]
MPPIHFRDTDRWRKATPFYKNNAGNWQKLAGWNRQQSGWGKFTSSGLALVIDANQENFNLKTYLQTNGLWSDTDPVVIDTLEIAAGVTIRSRQSNIREHTIRQVNRDASATVAYTAAELNSFYSQLPNDYGVTSISYTDAATNEVLKRFYAYQKLNEQCAFDTGNGWPAGSKINHLVINGVVFGQGGKGMGVNTKHRDSITQHGFTHAEHGWDALHTSIPVGKISVAGGLYGGGAGAGVIEVVTNFYDVQVLPSNILDITKGRLTSKDLVDNKLVDDVINYTNGSTPSTANTESVLVPAGHLGTAPQNGHPGGRGYGYCGTNTYGLLSPINTAPGKGTDGSFDGPGAKSPRFYSSGTAGESSSKIDIYVAHEAGGWGEDSNPDLAGYRIATTTAAEHFWMTVTRDKNTTSQPQLNVLENRMSGTTVTGKGYVIPAKGGRSVLGVANVGSFVGLENIKGEME